MKERNGVLLAVKLIFILSLVVLIYSVVQVVKAPIEAKQALNDWAKRGRKQSPTPVLPKKPLFPWEWSVQPRNSRPRSFLYRR